MAARLRHIALSVPDPDKAAKFFEEAFGMKRVGKAGIGCYVSDGTINVALLKYDGDVPGFHKGYHGLVHFGMWVDNLDEAAKKAAWDAFMRDAEWAEIKRVTAAEHGSLVGAIEDRVLHATDYSPKPT